MNNRKVNKTGLYLNLYHGFPDHESRDEADDWGEQGPLIGPLQYVHTTYASHIKFRFVDEESAKQFPELSVRNGVEADMSTNLDCLRYGDMFYGDWSVFHVDENEMMFLPFPFGTRVRAKYDLTVGDLDHLAPESEGWSQNDVLVSKDTLGTVIQDGDRWAVRFDGINKYFEQAWFLSYRLVEIVE